MKINAFWKPIIASLIATPICLFLGLASAGAGHGDYILATILFPYSILLIFAFGLMLPPFITVTLAIIQFPTYGIILGFAKEKKQIRSWAVLLLAVHVLAVIAGFSLRSRFM